MNTDKVESVADYGGDPQGVVKRWLVAIEQQERARKPFIERGEKIIKRFRDERPDHDRVSRFNILWSNVQTLKPALYARTPVPQVSRRFKDSDKVGREAAEILERAVSYSVEEYDFDGVMKAVVEDRLLPGIGVARVGYEPFYGEERQDVVGMDPETGDPILSEPYKPVEYERVTCEYVNWKDFLHGPGRTWDEVDWVAFKAYMSRDELVKRFGEVGHKVGLDFTPEGLESPPEQLKKAVVWEIWCKSEGKVYWVAPGHKEAPLDGGEPPLDFEEFFPNPRPLFATTTNDTLIPVPDFVEYQDQADELDELTARISALQKALKVAGAYDASAEGLKMLLSEGVENQLIPVDNWAAFGGNGGVDSAIAWLPIDMVVSVLMQLYQARETTKQTLYEITGISDIVRGASNPNETYGAQRIKGQYASMRLNEQQGEVARFARDLIKLKVEVIAENFEPQTVQLMTGRQLSPEVLQLIQNDSARSFRIDIETDSTIQPDEQADKEARVEFLNAVAGFMERTLPAAQEYPELGPLLGEMLMFGVRGFRAGRELETAFEEAVAAMENREPPPNPEMEKAKAEMQGEQEDRQLEQAKFQHDVQVDNREQNREDMELALKARETQIGGTYLYDPRIA